MASERDSATVEPVSIVIMNPLQALFKLISYSPKIYVHFALPNCSAAPTLRSLVVPGALLASTSRNTISTTNWQSSQEQVLEETLIVTQQYTTSLHTISFVSMSLRFLESLVCGFESVEIMNERDEK